MRVEKKEGLKKVKFHHNKKLFWVIVFVFIVLIGVVIALIILKDKEINNKGNNQIANPASVYCIENGGKLEIREDGNKNQYGICIFPDGKECEEWKYLGGECDFSESFTCSVDLECIPATCCHANSCVNKENAPDCSAISCTMSCNPGTLDCGQGDCKCLNNQCQPVLK